MRSDVILWGPERVLHRAILKCLGVTDDDMNLHNKIILVLEPNSLSTLDVILSILYIKLYKGYVPVFSK